mmetsp:Transcript_4069/g.7249  ORF Transcript_4069/g.7249 Transcript_4069/m.7249 type:complete len:718 (+) Transcript_4069:54-2207(+)
MSFSKLLLSLLLLSLAAAVQQSTPLLRVPLQEKHSKERRASMQVSASGGLHSHSRKEEDFPVDVVYTWVETPKNGSDAWIDIQETCGHTEIQRFRNYGTLRTSLLALEMFIPWVRKVFIVTRGEVPCGIGHISIPIEMVTHNQIYPRERQRRDLPTYNSDSLESHLHRIPDLAEHFIYFNDDMYIGRPLEKSFFFTPSGQAVYYQMNVIGIVVPQLEEAKGQCAATLQVEAKHQANPFRKSAIFEAQQESPEFFEELSRHRCRRGNVSGDSAPFWQYMCFHVRHGYAKVEQHPQEASAWHEVALLSGRNIAFAKSWYDTVLAHRPSKFCINDDFADVSGRQQNVQRVELADFLLRYFLPFPKFREISDACLSADSFSLPLIAHRTKRSAHTISSLVDLNIPDVNVNSLKQDKATPVDQLNQLIAHTLNAVEVRAHKGRQPLTCASSVRIIALNAERGRTWKQICRMSQSKPNLKGAHLYILNEMDSGMARTHNEDTTQLLAQCLAMDYVYGVEFVELTEGPEKMRVAAAKFGEPSSRSFHGNAILSAFPLEDVEILRLPGAEEFWHKGGFDGQHRLGGRMAIFATLPVVNVYGVRQGSVQIVSTHLDSFMGEDYNERSSRLISQKLEQRSHDTKDKVRRAIVAGDLGSDGRFSKAVNFLVHGMHFSPASKSHPDDCRLCRGDWIMLRGLPKVTGRHVTPSQGLSSHSFLTVDLQSAC